MTVMMVIIIETEKTHHSMKRQWFGINIAQFNTAIITQRCEQRQRLCELIKRGGGRRGVPEVKNTVVYSLKQHMYTASDWYELPPPVT